VLPAIWQKTLLFSLWVSPHVLLGGLAVTLYARRLYREFPAFFAYVLYEIAEFILLFTFNTRVKGDYNYAYAATLMFSIALRFAVIDEISRNLLRECRFLKVAARRSLQCATVLLIATSVVLAVYAPGDNNARWSAGIFVVNRGAAIVQCGMLLFLLLFSRLLGLSWRRHAFGIALGLGILTSFDIANFALRAEFTSRTSVYVLNFLITGSYLVSVLIWTAYSLAPEPAPAPVTILAHEEVETWSTEFQHLLRG